MNKFQFFYSLLIIEENYYVSFPPNFGAGSGGGAAASSGLKKQKDKNTGEVETIANNGVTVYNTSPYGAMPDKKKTDEHPLNIMMKEFTKLLNPSPPSSNASSAKGGSNAGAAGTGNAGTGAAGTQI